MTHKYSKCFHTCILFLINMVTCVYMGSHNHFKFKIVKENLQRVIRKLFQCNLRLVFVPGIFEWCSSAAICFMMCVPFYCFHLVSFFEWQFIEYLYIGKIVWDYSSVNVLFLRPKSGGKKTNSRLQKYVIYNCIEIL